MNSTEGLVFGIKLYLLCMGNKGVWQLIPTPFTSKREENRLNYTSLAFNEYTKNQNDQY